MAFIKLDCGVLDSTLWTDREAREVFITALLMALPFEVKEPMPQFKVRSIEPTGFVVPPGDYGLIRAAGVGIVRRAGIEQEIGLDALERLGDADPESRSPEWDGRRLVRVAGGFVALNYDKYRQRDQTAADRSRRYRERNAASRVPDRSNTQGEEEADPEGESARSQVDEFAQERKWLESLGAITTRSGGCIISEWKAVTRRLKVGQVEEIFKAVPGMQWPSEFKAHRKAMGV